LENILRGVIYYFKPNKYPYTQKLLYTQKIPKDISMKISRDFYRSVKEISYKLLSITHILNPVQWDPIQHVTLHISVSGVAYIPERP
jgi:hypothetical protein